MLPAAFYACAIAFYAGLAVVMLDLILLEEWRAGVKAIVAAALVFAAFEYTNKIIRHDDPMSFGYLIEHGQLDVKINNESRDDDYKDIDLTIFPDDRSTVYVGSAEPIDTVSGCSLISNLPDEIGPGEHVIFAYSPAPEPHLVPFSDRLRIHCDSLPRMSHISYLIRLVTGPIIGTTFAVRPLSASGDPSVRGTFTGKFRVFDVHSNFRELK